MALTDEQRELLSEPLDPRMGMFRKADRGRDVSYLAGFLFFDQANRIFGYDGWGYSVDRLDCLPMADGKGLLYSALVTVRVTGCDSRQDTGCHPLRNSNDGDGREKDNVNNPEQHDLARKSAVTDALKRAFRSFGDQFGNSLYDKDSDIHQAIHKAVREAQQVQQRGPQRPAAPAPAPVRPAAQAPAAPAPGPVRPAAQAPAPVQAGEAPTASTPAPLPTPAHTSEAYRQLEGEIKLADTLDELRAAGRQVRAAIDAGRIADEERMALQRVYAEIERTLTPQRATA